MTVQLIVLCLFIDHPVKWRKLKNALALFSSIVQSLYENVLNTSVHKFL